MNSNSLSAPESSRLNRMEIPSVEFYDTQGSSISPADQELIFFIENPSIKKMYPNLFVVLKRMMQNNAFRPFFLFLKRVANGPLTWNERLCLREGIYPGIKVQRAEYASQNGKITIYCSGENVPADIDVMTQVLSKNQYNISRENMKDKIVIDAGANVGAFSVYAAKLGAKKVYAFEPLKGTFEILKRNIAANGLAKTIVPLNMALGKSKGKARISYYFGGDPGASIEPSAQELHGANKSQVVKVVAIDEFMRNKGRVDFMKIDVERYEEEVFSGARKTIGRYKPVLSFSAYHYPDDSQRLDGIVRRIRPDYSCTLLMRAEEVLYCE